VFGLSLFINSILSFYVIELERRFQRGERPEKKKRKKEKVEKVL